jgi:hypothetical protein
MGVAYRKERRRNEGKRGTGGVQEKIKGSHQI